MSGTGRFWKVAAAIALVCTGIAAAAVVGVKIHKWRAIGKDPERGYLLQSEDGRFMANVPESWADNLEQAVEVKEELDLLKQRDAGELTSVVEKEVNGRLISRFLIFKYVLADGREIKSGDFDPDYKESMIEAQEQEIVSLLRANEFVTVGHEEREFGGRTLSFERNRFVLSDGTEVIWSVGRPGEGNQIGSKPTIIGPEEADRALGDKREIATLRQKDRRQLIAVDELIANGELDRRVFVYHYQLSDGRTKDLREGDEVKIALNQKQRQEWVELRDAGSGEDLGTYEETFKGRVFVFKRQRFVLSDGTDITWACGTPKDGK